MREGKGAEFYAQHNREKLGMNAEDPVLALPLTPGQGIALSGAEARVGFH